MLTVLERGKEGRKRKIVALASAVVIGTLSVILCIPTPASADCRGFGCNLVKGIPVIGPAAEAVDQGIAGIKDNGSDADVLHQATGLNSWNNPIGRPAAPPPPPRPRMGNMCVTQFGAFPGPFNPVGM